MKTNVQKNSVVKNNERQIDPYTALELLNNERIRSVIIQMISEYVVYFRRHDALEMYLNAFNPKDDENHHNCPFDGFSGVGKVLTLLGITPKEHFEFYEVLGKMAWDIIDSSKHKADLVALTVLSRWIPEINNYFNSKNL
ncbi:hypothetical protein [Chryseobacterium indologenes]|uniref:Uncharacterized protein n=1 Tax=Chryseobacterium indologenes TaxID=253 RepID=A0A0N0IV12_CHRID|nr:hypothetical protein [Chryseobacterium indologenes]KPE50121.1 hypothetical protein AOB46_16920 [Chryseobacterium indologenes]